MLGARGAASAMGCRHRCRCAAPLLAHVNLLLVLYGGASLAMAARLKWDPSAYIAVRELFPAEYVAAAVGTAAGGLVLLLLPHVAAAALLTTRPAARKMLLLAYAGALSLLVVCELALGAWLALRLWRWLDSEAARQLHDVIELRQNLKPFLRFVGRWHPAPLHLEHLIKVILLGFPTLPSPPTLFLLSRIVEAEEDAPCNLYVAGGAAAALAVLQPLAVALALRVALARTRSPPRGALAADTSAALVPRLHSASARAAADAYGERAPLRTAYKNGRLVVV